MSSPLKIKVQQFCLEEDVGTTMFGFSSSLAFSWSQVLNIVAARKGNDEISKKGTDEPKFSIGLSQRLCPQAC